MSLFSRNRQLSFEQREAQATKRQRDLNHAGKFSAPSGHSDTSELIIVSPHYDSRSQLSCNEQQAAYSKELERLKKQKQKRGRTVLEARGWAAGRAVAEALTDPFITDVTLIGPGNTGMIDFGRVGGEMGWYDLAMMADHLKLGVVEQRMFGEHPEEQGTVHALGKFVVAQPELAIATIGLPLQPALRIVPPAA